MSNVIAMPGTVAPARVEKLPMIEQLQISHFIRTLNVEFLERHLLATGVISLAEAESERVLIIAHIARCKLVTATEEEKRESEHWLKSRGIKPL
jgi:hypothetical protein